MRVLWSILVVALLLLVPLQQATARVPVAESRLPLLGRTIVIDPGHGGPDPGANRDGLTEKEIVLDMGLELRNLLTAAGASVVLTRETDVDLADSSLGNRYSARKRQDIRRRVELVNAAKPEILISLHVNAIASTRWRGAQVFFKSDCEPAKQLAISTQKTLTAFLQNTDRKAKPGDFRILNDAKTVGILVEAGFISNPDEADCLADPTYRRRVVWAVFNGILDWLNHQVSQTGA